MVYAQGPDTQVPHCIYSHRPTGIWEIMGNSPNGDFPYTEIQSRQNPKIQPYLHSPGVF